MRRCKCRKFDGETVALLGQDDQPIALMCSRCQQVKRNKCPGCGAWVDNTERHIKQCESEIWLHW